MDFIAECIEIKKERNKTMQKVRWAIAGTGNIANKFANAVKNADGAELVAVASRKMETAKEFAEKYDIGKCFGSYQELAEYDGVDAVYVALPHKFHAEHSILFMRNGKNVLCEKPVTVNEKQFKEVRRVAEENNVFLMEAVWTRFLPAMAKIKEIIASGKIGEVLELSADFCYNSSNFDHAIFDSECAGGGLLDVGIYGLNFASMFLGDEITDVKASAYVNNNVDERLNVLLTYKNGAIARVSSAITLAKPEDAWIYGSKGHIYLPRFYSISEFDVVVDGKREKYSVPYKGNGFEEEIEECNRCILAGKKQSDIMSLNQTGIIMKLMDDIRKQIGVVYNVD